MSSKVCRSCKVERPLSEFSFRKDNQKHRPDCKPCRTRESQSRRYGVSVGEIESLIEESGNQCMICGTHADDLKHSAFSHSPLVIDHDHETGEVRGLLCSPCNVGLGQFQDSQARLAAAIAYLNQ